MRSINITLAHGHFYNTDTRERILMKPGVNYILIHEKEEDIEIGQFVPPKYLRTGEAIYKELSSDSHVTHIKKIRKKGDYLYFFISVEQAVGEVQSKYTRFRLKLLEDLFLYSSNNWKNDELIAGGKLADCACVVDDSQMKQLDFFEPIYAKSVTSACKKTHIHYFGNDGSPSKNAFDSLYLGEHKNKMNLLESLRGFTDGDKILR